MKRSRSLVPNLSRVIQSLKVSLSETSSKLLSLAFKKLLYRASTVTGKSLNLAYSNKFLVLDTENSCSKSSTSWISKSLGEFSKSLKPITVLPTGA